MPATPVLMLPMGAAEVCESVAVCGDTPLSLPLLRQPQQAEHYYQHLD